MHHLLSPITLVNCRIFFSFLFAGLLGVNLAEAKEYAHREPFTRSVPFNRDGELVIENVIGDVEIRAWDKNEVSLDAEKSAETQEELQQIELTIESSPTRLAIITRLPKRSGFWFFRQTIRANVRYTLTVPATVNVRHIKTVIGRIEIEGLRGPVRAEVVNGAVEVAELLGEVRLSTVNGPIRANFSTLASNQKLSFTTINGGVTLGLPENVGTVLRASMVNGNVTCEYPLQLSEGQLDSRKLVGTLGNGQGALTAKTVNGNIHIRKHEGRD